MAAQQNIASVTDISLIQALEAYAAYQEHVRGKSRQQILRKVMSFWVDFALAKIPKGDSAVIREKLMRVITTFSKSKRKFKGKRANEYKGTLAAAIVGSLNYRGARNNQLARSTKFYADVQAFVNARAFSANSHRAALRPARTALRSPGAGMERRDYRKHASGNYLEEATHILVENFSSARDIPGRPPALGITGLAPGAFADALPQVIDQFIKFLAADVADNARKFGFRVPLT